MNETRPRYQIGLTRRTSTPSIRPIQDPPAVISEFNGSLSNSSRGDGSHSYESLRSVSPQIHRLGNLRLYSRESDPDMNVDGHYKRASTANNLDTSYEQTVERRVELDVKPPSLTNICPPEGGNIINTGAISTSTPNLSERSDSCGHSSL